MMCLVVDFLWFTQFLDFLTGLPLTQKVQRMCSSQLLLGSGGNSSSSHISSNTTDDGFHDTQ